MIGSREESSTPMVVNQAKLLRRVPLRMTPRLCDSSQTVSARVSLASEDTIKRNHSDRIPLREFGTDLRRILKKPLIIDHQMLAQEVRNRNECSQLRSASSARILSTRLRYDDGRFIHLWSNYGSFNSSGDCWRLLRFDKTRKIP
jgi:hypothetical protein